MVEAYNYYQLCFYVEVFLSLALIIFSYIMVRKVFVDKEFDIKKLNNKLSLIMVISIIISSFTFLTTYHEIKEPFGHPQIGTMTPTYSYISVYNYYFNFIYLFNPDMSFYYIFRSISIILYVISIIMCVKGYKKSNQKLLLISLGLGILANASIILDYYADSGNFTMNLGSNVTFTGIFTFLIALGIGIYQIIYKKKHVK